MQARLGVVVIATALLQTLLGQSASISKECLPQFEDYPVPTPLVARKTRAAYLSSYELIDIPRAQYSARIRAAAKGGPDFAGHYTIVQATCGSDCHNVWIVDVTGGEIYSTPFVGANRCVGGFDVPLVEYRLNSSLLVVTGSLEIPEANHTFKDGPCGKYYYRWDHDALTLVRSLVQTKDTTSFPPGARSGTKPPILGCPTADAKTAGR